MEKGLTGMDLYEQIKSVLGEPKTPLRALSPLTLAFVGDTVWALAVSTMVVNRGNAGGAKLNEEFTACVSARAQSRIALFLEESEKLTPQEMEIYRRGVNAKPHSKAKNASSFEYHKATGLEALAGYLFMSGQTERLLELMAEGLKELEREENKNEE